MKRRIRRALIVLLLGVMGYCAFQIVQVTESYRRGAELYARMARCAAVPDHSERSGENAAMTWPEVDFAALKEVNPDFVGWLSCEGTPIHYPVVQGRDNDYYLHHLFDGSEGRCGCIFLEAQNEPDFSQPHSILYGHHMKDGSMFKSLKGYREQSYYEEHPVLLLLTPEKRYRLEVFAGFVAAEGSNAWQLDFRDEQERQRWLEEQIQRSDFHSDVFPGPEERILTLSTCSYEFQNARYVVHTVLREGESS